MWDQLIAQGAEPASFAALDKVRVEAALLFYGYDMTNEHYPSEVGLGWAISKNGADYRGKGAALAAMGNERHVLAGLSIDHTAAVEGGEALEIDRVDVGVLNSPAFSHRLRKSLALAHVRPNVSAPGTQLKVVGDGVIYDATVETIPFFDPEKTRTHAS